MRMVTIIIGGFLVAAASAAGAQPMAQSHQNQGSTPHEAMGQVMTASGEKCCCEEMMNKMMSEMMQNHKGMGMKDALQAQPDHAH